MHITIQSDVFGIILLTTLICVLVIFLSKKIQKLNPLEKPKGLVFGAILLVQNLQKQVDDSVGKKVGKILGPYIVTIAIYIFLSNISGLFGMDSPTGNLSVTLALTLIAWTVQQIAQFKYSGAKAYFHEFLEPFVFFLPMNIFSKFSTILSMSLRLFGNVLCGGIILSVVSTFCQTLSTSIIGLFTTPSSGVFNFMAPILTPVLHAYFDLFSGFIQTLIFITLTMVFIGNEIPDDIKNQKEAEQKTIQQS